MDMQLPERFDVNYIGEDGEKHRAVMLHRAGYGSLERFIGILIEHYAGAFPTWIAPVQAKIIPVTDKNLEYAKSVAAAMSESDIRVEVEEANETLGYKIRKAQMEKVPYMIIVGDQEMKGHTISVRSRKNGDLGSQSLPMFVANLIREIKERENRRLAYFGNVNYSFKGVYGANVTVRRDGTNQLGRARKSRWLPTWNVSGSWTPSEDDWFKKWAGEHHNWLSYGKLRLSYSLTGESTAASNALPIFRSTEVWRPDASQQEIGVYYSQPANNELTYEKKHEFNIGVDLGFLDNRINLVTDFYWRNNYDLIGYRETQTNGRQQANVATMKSHGIEATLSTHNIRTKDWNWTTDLTFSWATTEITKLLSYSNVISLVSSSGYALEGYPHRALFSIPFVGLNDEGLPTIINEKGEITTTNINFQEYNHLSFLKYEGPTEPTFTGGLNNTLKWRNWRLNVFITYSFGNKLRLDPVFSVAYSDQSAMPKEFKNRWVEPGDEHRTTVPAIASVRQYYNDNYLGYAYNAYNYSTARVANGGFIRMKDISLTYDFFSTSLSSSFFLSSAAGFSRKSKNSCSTLLKFKTSQWSSVNVSVFRTAYE